ncbi:hypothetical protein CHS0354_020368 [Potamilus streckersoni]|uniref:Uncharacterized protein n=1 Tax=Potamilus streckersoni TaxID=2493646 RepID=A0AAE0SFJ8_9BIVA|nr:hypothetical protein CHS0354_020368 [Potamilus streckersoni]
MLKECIQRDAMKANETYIARVAYNTFDYATVQQHDGRLVEMSHGLNNTLISLVIASFNRIFITDFTRVTACFYDLVKNRPKRLEWSEKCYSSLMIVVEKLSEEPVLKLTGHSFNAPMHLILVKGLY